MCTVGGINTSKVAALLIFHLQITGKWMGGKEGRKNKEIEVQSASVKLSAYGRRCAHQPFR